MPLTAPQSEWRWWGGLTRAKLPILDGCCSLRTCLPYVQGENREVEPEGHCPAVVQISIIADF